MSKINIFSLGGLNEDGKNMYVVEVDDDIFVFDAGLKFADEKMLGIDYIIPNFDYLKQNIKRVKGIFITHSHDENMGALPDIIRELPDINIYGTKFTIEILNRELMEDNIICHHLNELKPHQKITFGSNAIFPISVTHSTPGCVGYALYTPDGIIFYTGDFVFDSTMTGPYKTDIGKLAYVGKQGVLCLLSESIYAEKSGHTSPNHRISSIIRETIGRNDGRIVFTVLSSHLYRIQELFNEVANTKRKVVIMGKRLHNIINKAIDMKFLTVEKDMIGDLSNLNDENVVILVSNERERPFANLDRIVNGYDKYIKIKNTDTVFFATPPYEGMEKTVTRLADEISKIGANIVTLSPKKHLGYHASSEDLMLMIDLMQPKYYMPVKGEYRYQVAGANAASMIGYKSDQILLKQNGDVVTFENGILKENGETRPIDSILIDGKSSNDIGELVLKDRELLSDNGIVIVSATLDKKTKQIVAGPEILTRGFIYVKDNKQLINESINICSNLIKENITSNYIEFNKIKNGIRDSLSKYLYKETECKPMIITVIQEI